MLLQDGEQNQDEVLEDKDGPDPALAVLVPIGQRLPPDFDVVREQPAVDGFGGVSHEGAALKAGLLQEPGQSAAMVQVEAGG